MASVVQQPAVAAPFRHESWSSRERDDRFLIFFSGWNKRKALPIQKGSLATSHGLARLHGNVWFFFISHCLRHAGRDENWENFCDYLSTYEQETSLLRPKVTCCYFGWLFLLPLSLPPGCYPNHITTKTEWRLKRYTKLHSWLHPAGHMVRWLSRTGS